MGFHPSGLGQGSVNGTAHAISGNGFEPHERHAHETQKHWRSNGRGNESAHIGTAGDELLNFDQSRTRETPIDQNSGLYEQAKSHERRNSKADSPCETLLDGPHVLRASILGYERTHHGKNGRISRSEENFDDEIGPKEHDDDERLVVIGFQQNREKGEKGNQKGDSGCEADFPLVNETVFVTLLGKSFYE